MNKKINSILLSFLEIVTYIFSGIFAIATVGLIVIGLEKIFRVGTLYKEFISDFISKSVDPGIKSTSMFSVLVLLISILVSIIIFFEITVFIRRIVKNLKHEIYFNFDNLKNIRWIMYSAAFFLILDVLSKIVFDIVHLNIFYTSWSEIFVSALVFLGIYVIYLVFKRGVELQEDSDSLI
ncbi:DUF2975 domain-containing protein [Xylocopilactobacillus apis]|uniref:DUF2975 domain-containing protein n=1 Tax=Xylocopilactobacillus apis TaxID=2932183 RepID=A0AAU9D3K2_9LACO|nr:DUF2975 domain-containing protein [Xylocopilactobacillus apis]BDR57116.1 hypothetical protein KIMC2_16780 [Xylocopilactobacillus apis]